MPKYEIAQINTDSEGVSYFHLVERGTAKPSKIYPGMFPAEVAAEKANEGWQVVGVCPVRGGYVFWMQREKAGE